MAKTVKKRQTVRQALDAMRKKHRGKVEDLYLNKRELFYGVKDGKFSSHLDSESVYPVSREVAEAEAAYFKVPLSEV